MGVIDTLKNLAGVQEATQSFKPEVNLTATQLLRQTPQTAVNVQLQEFQRGQAKDLQLQQISQQQQQLQEYLKTPSGIYQYAQESGIQPDVRTVDKSYFVDGTTPVPYKETTYTYNTPQGTTSYTESDLGQNLKELGQSRSLIQGTTPGTLQYNPEVSFLYGNPADWNESNFAMPNKSIPTPTQEYPLPTSSSLTPTIMAYNSQTGQWGTPQPYNPNPTNQPMSDVEYQKQIKKIQDAGFKLVVSGDKVTGLEGYGQSIMLGGSIDTATLSPELKSGLEEAGVISKQKQELKKNYYMPLLPGLITGSGEQYWNTKKETYLINPKLLTSGGGPYIPVSADFLTQRTVNINTPNNNLTPNQLNEALLNPSIGFKDSQLYKDIKLPETTNSFSFISSTSTNQPTNLNIAPLKFNSNYSPSSFLSSQSRDYSLILIPFTDKGFSSSGLHDWIGESIAKSAQNQKLYVSDIPPYKLRGSMSPETFTFESPTFESYLNKNKGYVDLPKGTPNNLTPNQLNQALLSPKYNVTKTKTDIFSLINPEQQNAILSERNRVAGNTARFVGMGAVYTGEYLINPGGARALNFLEGAEKFLTPKGKEVTRQINEAYGPVLAYGIPTAQIVLGVYGLRNMYMNAQANALKSAKGFRSLTESQPFSKSFEINGKEYTDYFSRQVTTKKINSPGFRYSIKTEIVPRNPMDITKGFVRRFVKEPTLFGDRIINPTLTVASQQELIPIAGGYAFTGFGKASMSVQNPFTGNFKTVLTNEFPVGGIATPREVAKFMGQDFKPAYSGEAWAGLGTKKTKEFFGGIPVAESKSGITTVVSGPYNKISQWTDIDLRGVPQREFSSFAKVKTPGVGYVYPEIDLTANVDKGFTFIKRIDKRALATTPQILELPKPKPTLSISSTQSTNQLLNDFIGAQIGSVGAKQIPDFLKTYPIPSVWVATKTESPTKYVPITTPFLLTKTDTITIPKIINIPTPKPSDTDWIDYGTGSRQITVPKLVQVPQTIQLTTQLTTPKYVQNTQQLQNYMKPNPLIPPVIDLGGNAKNNFKFIKTPIKGKGLFTTEFRRRGKFFPIAQTTSLPFAVAVGKKAARQTLGASFRIRKPTGAIFPIQPTQEFRLGKGEGILVQGSRVRLSSGFERQEIARTRVFKGMTIYPKGSKNLFGMAKITKTTKSPFTF